MEDEIKRQIWAQADPDRVVVLDFPLLTENPREGLAAWIVVDIDPEIAIRRLVEQRGMDEQDARKRIASQPSREQRLARATHVIQNDGDLGELRTQVGELWESLHVTNEGV